jgi:hypothetical protein
MPTRQLKHFLGKIFRFKFKIFRFKFKVQDFLGCGMLVDSRMLNLGI